jgi:alpha-amylase/alpha-mannosidase (GH57 family)
MAKVALALWWHQHQPYYPNNVGRQNPMPWVRLHGVKDYYGMALQLLEFPEMRCAINLVPSLLLQLEDYTERNGSDHFLDVSRSSADSLSEKEALFVLDNFFMAHPFNMIRPFARYAELYERRGFPRAGREVLGRFQVRDLRDLQVWFNLAWIHPLAFERDSALRELRDRGRNYSEEDKNCLLARHVDILKEVIPLHRRLAETGQVELTTTPFYHPILPLLFDKRLARESISDAVLPRYMGGYPDDAEIHVRRAIDNHGRVFGQSPAGMWPSEGSVCQAMLPLLVRHGVRWIGTDEEILSRSTQGFVGRDARGHVRNADRLYQPYRVEEAGTRMGIIFRDHVLSDLIGFHYQRADPQVAADDFVSRLRCIGQSVHRNEPAVVSVILDGENCWEHYPGQGVTFLRALYGRLAEQGEIEMIRPGAYLEAHPPGDGLPHLFPGSWINHNFAIWVGHQEDNTAWDALHRAREHLLARSREMGAERNGATGEVRAPTHEIADRVQKAWEEVYIAEGSDWFWWYGDDHSSAQDALFDSLFRKHLENVYRLLGDSPPADLARPISRRGHWAVHSMPRALLDVEIDGRASFFEWVGAGHYACGNERGTMAMASRSPFSELLFGFDARSFLLRIDCRTAARTALAELSAIRLGFAEPAGWALSIQAPASLSPGVTLLAPGSRLASGEGIEVAVDRIVELRVPLDRLGLKAGDSLHFFVEGFAGSQSQARAPQEGVITLTCPASDFEQQMWSV